MRSSETHTLTAIEELIFYWHIPLSFKAQNTCSYVFKTINSTLSDSAFCSFLCKLGAPSIKGWPLISFRKPSGDHPAIVNRQTSKELEVALISDQHFGCNGFNQSQHSSYEKFYNNIFFPTLLKRKIKYVFDLGDTFDRNAGINIDLISWSRSVYFDRLCDLGIKLFVLRGNHNPRAKFNHHVGDAISLISRDYPNITLLDETTVIQIANRKFCFVPYLDHRSILNVMRSKWRPKYFGKAKDTKADLFFTHLAFRGCFFCEKKRSDGGFGEHLIKYLNGPVISGHYHTRSVLEHVPLRYLGSPYATRWGEFEVDRGFHLLDTNSLAIHYIKNKYQAFRCMLVNSLKDIDKLEQVMKIEPALFYIIPSHRDENLMEEFSHKLSQSDLNDCKLYDSTEKLNSLLYRLISMKEYGQAKAIINHAIDDPDIFTLLNTAHVAFGLGMMDKGVEYLCESISRSKKIDDASLLTEFNEKLVQISKAYLTNLRC